MELVLDATTACSLRSTDPSSLKSDTFAGSSSRIAWGLGAGSRRRANLNHKVRVGEVGEVARRLNASERLALIGLADL